MGGALRALPSSYKTLLSYAASIVRKHTIVNILPLCFETLAQDVDRLVVRNKVRAVKLFGRLLKRVPEGYTLFYFDTDILLHYAEFCLSYLDCIRDNYSDFEDKSKNMISRFSSFFNLCRVALVDFVKIAKYITADPIPRFCISHPFTQRPPRPDEMSKYSINNLLYTGSLKRMVKDRFNRRKGNLSNDIKPSVLRFGWSFLQSIKRGCRSVPKEFIYNELIKHMKNMSIKPSLDSYDIDESTGLAPDYSILQWFDGHDLVYDPTVSINVIKHNPAEVFFGSGIKAFMLNKTRPAFTFTPQWYEPSHNSSMEYTRSQGGSYRAVLEEFRLPLVESDVILSKDGPRRNLTYQIPEPSVLSHWARGELLDYEVSHDDFLSSHIGMSPKSDMIKTQVVPLPEPLKVRVITKSEAVPAYYAKSFQKVLKKWMDSFPQLALTNERVNKPIEEHFCSTWKLQSKLFSDFKLENDFVDHVSGDYSGATDGCDINLTKLLFENSMDQLLHGSSEQIEADKFILRRVLYEQCLVYNVVPYDGFIKVIDELNGFKYYINDQLVLSKDVGVHFHTYNNMRLTRKTLDLLVSNLMSTGDYKARLELNQSNGQLMGSILSFPILCQMNLLCYKLALEEYLADQLGSFRFSRLCFSIYKTPGIPIKFLPCLVNGDDIYFRTNAKFYEIWLKWIKRAGFSLSIGKNYVHKSIFTINSRCFSMCDNEDTLDQNYQGTVPSCLQEVTYLNCGLLRCKSKSGNSEPKSIDVIYNKVISGAQNKVFARNMFLHYNDKMLCLASRSGTYNYFIPKLLGGLGMRDDNIKVTHFQINLASSLKRLSQDPFFKNSGVSYVQKKQGSLAVPYLGDKKYTYCLESSIPEGFQLITENDFGPFSLIESGSKDHPYRGVLRTDNDQVDFIVQDSVLRSDDILTHSSGGTLYSKSIIDHDPQYRYTCPPKEATIMVRNDRDKLYYFGKTLYTSTEDGLYYKPCEIDYDTIVVESIDTFTDTKQYMEFQEKWFPQYNFTVVPQDDQEVI